MRKEVAELIPALQVEVTDAAEDWFYILMCAKGKVSLEIGRRTADRLKGYSEEAIISSSVVEPA